MKLKKRIDVYIPKFEYHIREDKFLKQKVTEKILHPPIQESNPIQKSKNSYVLFKNYDLEELKKLKKNSMKPEFFRWDTGKKFIDLLNFINQFFCVSGNKVNYCVLDIMNKFLEENLDINDLETFYINEINIELTYTTVISNCKDLDSFINSPQVTYNRFLVIYEDVFNQVSSKDLNILFNICISNNDLVRSLISDSNYLDLESIIDGIKTVIDKYKHIETYKTLIHHVTQNYQKFLVIYHDLFNQLNPKQLDLLCSICISNNGLVKLLISNLNR